MMVASGKKSTVVVMKTHECKKCAAIQKNWSFGKFAYEKTL